MAEEGKIKIDKFDGHNFRFWKMQIEDYLQALGAVRLSLTKNVAYNVVNEKTTYDLFKALSNMYEKPSASNKVFLIRQLVNTKMNEGASVADHVNEFNSILSRLMSVDIKFDDEVQALLLLSSLPESWSGTVTAVSGSTGSTKLKFDNIRDLILGEDIRRKTSGEYSNSLLSAEDKGRGRKQDRGQKHNRSRSKSKKRGQSKNRQDITCWNCNQKGHFQNYCSKPITSRDKEVNMATRDYDDALVCCVENTIDDRIIDSSASFHATYCEEELECSGKVRLADDKTLDIAGIGDVLDEEGCHVGFRDQQWKVTKGRLVVARGNKRGSMYMVEVPSDRINAAIDGFCEPCVLGKQKKVIFVKSVNTRKLQRLELVHTDVYGSTSVASIGGPATMLPLLMTATGRLHAGLPKMFWEDSVTTAAYLINRGPSMPLGFRISEEEWQRKEVSLAHLTVYGCDSYVKVKDVASDKLDAKSVKCTFIGYGSDEMGYHFWDSKSHKAATDSSNLTKPNQKDQVVLEDSPENLANNNMVTKHVLNEKTLKTKHPLRREAPRLHSYEDPPESPGLRQQTICYWQMKAINEEMVSLEKNQPWCLVRFLGRKKALQSKWVFRVKEEQDGKKRYKARLVVKGFQPKQGVDYNEIFSPVVKMTTIRLVLSIIATENLHLEQLDVKTTFLHDDLDEYIYMTQPESFQSAGKEENLVCKLKKSLYGLKQAPRQWYLKFDSFIQRQGLRHGKNQEAQETVVLRIRDEGFRMRRLDVSLWETILSSIRNKHLRQRLQDEEWLREHWEAVKWLLHYLKDYGGCLDSGKSTTGYVFTVGGTAVSWMSRIQKCVAMSTTEAEYMAIAEAGKELVWLKNFLKELDRAQTECVLFCDNPSAIYLAKNLVFHGRTKHIKIRYHYIRELVSKGTLSLKKILRAKNPADMLTKVVTTEKLKLCAASTGLRDN
ncbi:retrovirus-related pol polyprotein from transposon TNT 1-94 [Tanacetum coccineum]